MSATSQAKSAQFLARNNAAARRFVQNMFSNRNEASANDNVGGEEVNPAGAN